MQTPSSWRGRAAETRRRLRSSIPPAFDPDPALIWRDDRDPNRAPTPDPVGRANVPVRLEAPLSLTPYQGLRGTGGTTGWFKATFTAISVIAAGTTIYRSKVIRWMAHRRCWCVSWAGTLKRQWQHTNALGWP